MIHIDKIDGYQIFSHNPQAKDISDAIYEILANKNTNIKVKLNPVEQDNIEETSFEKQCAKYFEENFETLATEAPLVLPTKEPEKFKEIVKTMKHWCRKTNKLSSIKGLVLHSFSILRHLQHFGFTSEAIKDSLKIEEFSGASIIFVYNLQKNVVLLIRNAESQDLANDIRLGLDDLKMFMLLFNDKLKKSNLKLISLVVTDQAPGFELKCSNCMNNVLSLEEFKDLATFENWWQVRTMYFEKESAKNINPDFMKNFLAKVTGTVAATFIFGEHIPTLTDKSDEKMENLRVLLTREQMEIVYSQDKHIIIKGGFGCGKTVIAAAMFKKIAESLKNDEKLYYICYDPRSELLNQITEGVQTADVANVKLFHNKERRSLSEIIKDVLEKRETTRKINFVVDEYDGEDLDQIEAERLNKVFNKSLKQMFIILIVQPIEKSRVINKIIQEKNMFALLENMKLYQLNRVMRNSIEIHNLVKLTTDVLKKEQTIFVHQKDSTMESKLKTDVSNVSVPETDTVMKLGIPVPDNSAKLPSKQEDDHKNEGAQDEDAAKANITLDDVKVVTESVKGIRHGDPCQYLEENPRIHKLGLDEAQAVSRSVTKKNKFLETAAGLFDFRAVKTISEFRFAPVEKTGHKIGTKKPAFFELGNRSDFQKVLSLLAIFEEREIEKSEQVVLHFDTEANEVPNVFRFLFACHFEIQEKVTTKYAEFKAQKKPILVCSYPTFRGLEHPKVTVVIDCDIYYVQHYLVETLARCTSDLCVVVLQKTSTMTKVTTEWKTKQAIQQWEIKISGDISQEEDFEIEFTRGTNTKIINAKFRSEYYKKLEKEYVRLVTKDKKIDSKKELEARKVINER